MMVSFPVLSPQPPQRALSDAATDLRVGRLRWCGEAGFILPRPGRAEPGRFKGAMGRWRLPPLGDESPSYVTSLLRS